MTLEVGKYYRTRDGRKVGPIIPRPDSDEFDDPFMWADSDGGIWAHNGENGNSTGYLGEPDDGDIIAEWTDNTGPLRTVTTTRHEIVPGVYGRVVVDWQGGIRMDATQDADELTATIATLTAIRDAMQANTTA